MRDRIPIDLASARKVFSYDPETGLLLRGGLLTGTVTEHGYLRVSFGPVRLLAHRIGWALHHGEQPPRFLDHINGNRLDNRIANLRSASRSENARNRKRHRNSSTGVKGVYVERPGFYRAAIRVDTVLLRLGVFQSIDEAKAAYAEAAKIHHGEFARCD